MELISISNDDFRKVISEACGKIDELTLEWEPLDKACQNIFKKKDSHCFLRKALRIQTTGTGIHFERQLFDRYEDTWSQAVQDGFEKSLGIAKLLDKDGVQYELFRFWSEADQIDKETGMPTGKKIHLEYIGQKK